MSRNTQRKLVLIARHFSILLVTSLFAVSTVTAEELSQRKVATSLNELRIWLGENQNAQSWHEYLHSDTLETQLDLGESASVVELKVVLKQYQGDARGLELEQFVSVKDSLYHWTSVLEDAPTNLSEEVKAAADSFAPVTAAEVQTAKNQLIASTKVLESLLRRSSGGDQSGWKDYLRWDDMQAEISSEQPKAQVLEEIFTRYRSGENGLEMRQFTAVRRALRNYINKLFFAGNTQFNEQYQIQLKLLSEELEEYAQVPNSQQSQLIGGQLGWLEQGGQVPDLVDKIRSTYNQSNLFLTASQPFLAAGIERPIDDVADIREEILGTRIYGEGHTVGELQLNLVPSQDSAILELMMTGVNNSKNIGYNRSVVIHTRGVTQIDGRKRLILDANGIRALAASASCSTSTIFDSIYAPSKFVTKIANKRAYKQKAEAEAIGSRKAEYRVAERMNSEAGELLAELNEKIREQFQKPLKSRDSFPAKMNFSTTTEGLHLEMMQVTRFQLAAPTAPPSTVTGKEDLAVQLHESMINNFGEAILGGVKLTDEGLVELLEQRGEEVPEELQITDDKDPWSITFDYIRPIEVQFNEGQVAISIRGRQFTRNETAINKTVRIGAVYNISKGKNGAKLVRDGDVKLEFVLMKKLGAREIAFKTFMVKKFDAIFQKEIVGEGLKMQGEWEKLGPLPLSLLSSKQGWLSMGWNLPAQTKVADSHDSTETVK
ncbi:MAG: hypothetical protein COA78_07310 [Blastopirellula sp.]|nr:MAG: hypothetical protein COA78_07310 [Blastopirellula sp.]